MEQHQLSDFRYLNDELRECYGSTCCYKHALSSRTFSEGVNYAREKFNCFWLIDKILLNSVRIPASFQTWKLSRIIDGQTRTNNFILTCEYDAGVELHSEQIHSADFPGDMIDFFLQNNILYLPSED